MGGCVVIVEDDEDVLELLHDVFAIEAYEVVGIPHVDGLDDRIAAIHPDVFLIDIMLHGTSGIEVTERLRHQGYDATPIIAMSASSVMLQVAEESNLFHEVIAKPFD